MRFSRQLLLQSTRTLICWFSYVLILTLLSCEEKKEQSPQPDPALTITGLTPTSGPKNTLVVISGTGFSPVASENSVLFNGKAATVTKATSTELTVEVPSKAGSGAVTVTVKQEAATGPVFEYVSTVNVSTLAGSSEVGLVDGPGSSARFNFPRGMALDEAGVIYVADCFNKRIRKITPAGVVSSLPFSPVAGQTSLDNPLYVELYRPYDVAADKEGNVYITDKGNNRIRKFSTIPPLGNPWYEDLAGGLFPEWKDEEALPNVFNEPEGILLDASGNILVADAGYSRIRKLTPQKTITTIAGRPNLLGEPRFADGVATQARFNWPAGIEVDQKGNLYVADRANHRIRKITPEGRVSTLAGDGQQGYQDGAGPTAQFFLPNGVAVDTTGNVYVADGRNHRIRVISPAGVVTTLAGTGVDGYKDGKAEEAQFSEPYGILVDPAGNVYVTDGNRVRKIVIE